MARASTYRYLLAGGGTGGHIYPALAIADALRRERPESEFLFVGAAGKMEMRRVPAAGYRIEAIPVMGFHRGADLRNLRFPFKLVRSLLRARSIVAAFGPSAAIGTGGYVSGPALAAARLRGVPVFVQEQNAFPGVTNRLLAQGAEAVFAAYDEARPYFPAGRLRHSGNPLRLSLDPTAMPHTAYAKTHFGLDATLPVLLSFGGSLGARSMNEAHDAMTGFWRKHHRLQLIWQTGEGYYDRYKDSATARLPNVTCVKYLERMDLAYAAADLVSCRAGALSISELQLLGKAAVLIPSPNVSGDHQTANARAIETGGGAILVPDAEQEARLAHLLPQLLADADATERMAQRMAAMAKPSAARDIARAIIAYVEARP